MCSSDLPSVLLLGSAPTYLLAWTLWRVLSALMPARLYQRVDDRLYCVYQNMVLFFFENYTGVQVRRGRAGLRASPPRGRGGACNPGEHSQPGEHVPQLTASRRGGKFLVLTSGFLLERPAEAECVPGSAPPPPRAGCYCPSQCLPK